MAMKVTGSKRDSRPHEIIRGVVVSRRELPVFCRQCMASGTLCDIFFPQKPDPDCPENWSIRINGRAAESDPGGLFAGRNYRDICSFYDAVREVVGQRIHVQLLVDDDIKEKVLICCLCMAEQARLPLFALADGECTMKNPDILILDRITYQDAGRYRSMTLKDFLQMGRRGKNISESGQISEEEKHVDEIVSFSLNYFYQPQISDFELYEYLGMVQQKEPVLYRQFIRSLRRALFELADVEYNTERYIKLLYVAYKKIPDTGAVFSPDLELAPYDYTGMNRFLRERFRTRRELKNMQIAMLTVPFQECITGKGRRIVEEAARRVVD